MKNISKYKIIVFVVIGIVIIFLGNGVVKKVNITNQIKETVVPLGLKDVKGKDLEHGWYDVYVD